MLKKLLISFGIVLLLLSAAVVTVLINPQLLRGAIHEGGQRFAGLDIQVEQLSSHRNPLRLEIQGLVISNPNWPEPTLLRLDALSLQLLASPFNKTAFWSLHSNGLQVNIAQNSQGEINWITPELSGQAPQQESEPATTVVLPGDFNFQEIILSDSRIHVQGPDNSYQLSLPEIRGQRSEAANGLLSLELNYQEQRFSLSGAVNLFDPSQGILDYQLAIEHSDAQLNSEGRLALSPDLSGSQLNLGLRLQSIAALAALVGIENPPALPASSLSTDLIINDGYHLDALKLAVGDNQLNGEFKIAKDLSSVDADLSSPKLDIDALLALLPAPPADATVTPLKPEEAPLDWQWLSKPRITARLNIEALKASGWALQALQGELSSGQQIDIDLTLEQAKEIASGRQLNTLALNARLSPLAARTQGADMALQATLSEKNFRLETRGQANLNGLAGNQLRLNAKAPRSADIWALVQQPWQEAGALSLEGELSSDGQRYTIDSTASLGKQDIAAQLELKPGSAAEPGNISGEISIKNLSLAFMNAAPNSTQSSPPENKSSRKKLLSDEPIAVDALKTLNGDLQLELINVDTGYAYIEQAKLKPQLSNGVLTLDNSRIRARGAEAQLALKLDTSGATPALHSQLKVNGDNYGLLGLEKAAGIRGGKGDIHITLAGRGASPAALAASLDGQIDVKITDIKAKANALNLIGSDVLTETFNKLNPFREKRETTDIQCLAVHFKGKQGRFASNDGIALETETSKIIGTGHVDLAKEELLFGISPIARKGVGINVGAAAGLVRLGGSFSKPRVQADPGGMFTSGLSTGAAIYTGGLSLVAQGLMKRALYAGSACDGELEEIPSVEALPPELLQPALPPEGAEPGQATPPASELPSAPAANGKP